jgi:hypothetical protein
MLQVAALLVFANATLAQGLATSRYPVSEADIAKALSVVGLSVEASQVHLPVQMNAAIESPKLEIVTAKPMGNSQLRLELRCPTVAECLPFFAMLDVENVNLISAEIQSKSVAAIAASHQPKVRIGDSSATPMRLRVGSHAVLVIRDGHLDIRLQVLAIDSGVMGEQVRVCTLDRKKVFHATVIGEATVTGVME